MRWVCDTVEGNRPVTLAYQGTRSSPPQPLRLLPFYCRSGDISSAAFYDRIDSLVPFSVNNHSFGELKWTMQSASFCCPQLVLKKDNQQRTYYQDMSATWGDTPAEKLTPTKSFPRLFCAAFLVPHSSQPIKECCATEYMQVH